MYAFVGITLEIVTSQNQRTFLSLKVNYMFIFLFQL